MKEQTKIIDDKAHLPAIYVEHLGEGEKYDNLRQI